MNAYAKRLSAASLPPIVCESVEKKTGGFELGPINFELEAGRICALLGANGAGKSTLLQLLIGLQRPSAGDIWVDGQNPYLRRDRLLMNRIGFVPDDPTDLIEEFTAREYWAWCARLRSSGQREREAMGVEATRLSRMLNFEPPSKAIRSYSHGMRKKTQLVAALQHQPRIVILDEPRNGLDPISELALEEIFKKLAYEGVSILVATHDLYWAERRADDILILNAGKQIQLGTLEETRQGRDLISRFVEIVQTAEAQV